MSVYRVVNLMRKRMFSHKVSKHSVPGDGILPSSGTGKIRRVWFYFVSRLKIFFRFLSLFCSSTKKKQNISAKSHSGALLKTKTLNRVPFSVVKDIIVGLARAHPHAHKLYCVFILDTEAAANKDYYTFKSKREEKKRTYKKNKKKKEKYE